LDRCASRCRANGPRPVTEAIDLGLGPAILEYLGGQLDAGAFESIPDLDMTAVFPGSGH
jgi:hypothetical protein